MSELSLAAALREVTGKKVKHLRTQGIIPGTIYGKGVEPISVQIDGKAFQAVYKKAGRTALIDVNLPGKAALAVFVQDLQRHPVTRAILHIDLRAVDLKTAITVDVPVVAIGESPIVARGDAVLNHALSVVHVLALPADLPQHIEVDISGLDAMDKSIQLKDLPTGAGYTIQGDPETVILSLSQLRAAEDATTDASAPAEPELIRKPRDEDE